MMTDFRNATGFFDARCEKCGARIRWCGTLSDRPPCSRCAHVVESEVLAADEKALLDNDTLCNIQTLRFEYFDDFGPSEQQFIKNMHKVGIGKKGYTATQRASINRMIQRYTITL